MQDRIDKREIEEKVDPIIDARNYHRAQMLTKIIHGMDVHASNVFDEIENVYSGGSPIPKSDIEEFIRDIRRGIDAMELYFW